MRHHKKILATLAVLGALLSTCGGGGGGSSSPSPTPTPIPTPTSPMVVWDAPKYFDDDTPLVPVNDLEYYEIYVKQDPSFGPDDEAITTAPPGATSFDLAALAPSLSKEVTYYASVRAVPVAGEKSDFSTPASFSISQ